MAKTKISILLNHTSLLQSLIFRYQDVKKNKYSFHLIFQKNGLQNSSANVNLEILHIKPVRKLKTDCQTKSSILNMQEQSWWSSDSDLVFYGMSFPFVTKNPRVNIKLTNGLHFLSIWSYKQNSSTEIGSNVFLTLVEHW